jgi:hypothetical protein
VVVREAYVGGFLGDQRAANGDSPDAALEAGPPPA